LSIDANKDGELQMTEVSSFLDARDEVQVKALQKERECGVTIACGTKEFYVEKVASSCQGEVAGLRPGGAEMPQRKLV